ncbi:predicted protein [Chaetomium globosum CBS 148.51]|uniref:Uncharacterized protein n=1 Tax=Chaetomium globosum (strain ATCC 6205 / CBS 148.51 / DSM 1962 / NBRC 6347 / NRRL 1970) TaxID=306901 RepID=Q2H623_CHAGB|nr:uncharacterized protein CHGG_05892 [Chaetomium globosum CBS 148.51]EAQ89273.1 predicted protein [Chaetomium globosum CBS 148.51]
MSGGKVGRVEGVGWLGGRCDLEKRGRDWGGWRQAAMPRSVDGPARFSKQPASGAEWKAGAGARVGGARGPKGVCGIGWHGVELMGPPSLPQKMGPLQPHGVFRALGSRRKRQELKSQSQGGHQGVQGPGMTLHEQEEVATRRGLAFHLPAVCGGCSDMMVASVGALGCPGLGPYLGLNHPFLSSAVFRPVLVSYRLSRVDPCALHSTR